MNKIEGFIHCKTCIKNIPKDESPHTWGSYECGFMKNGDIQVWCKRCDKEVMCVPAEPNKVYSTKKSNTYDWGVK